MATRYENVIGNWENNTSNSDAVLDGTSTNVFEPWMLNMLKRWHKMILLARKKSVAMTWCLSSKETATRLSIILNLLSKFGEINAQLVSTLRVNLAANH